MAGTRNWREPEMAGTRNSLFLQNYYGLVFHTITPLESTGLEHWKVFQMAKFGREEKKIVALVRY